MTDDGTVTLDIPEMAISGPADLIDLSPCPPLESLGDSSQTVTGMFVTTHAAVLDLSVDGLAEPNGVTASHPFWSVDRNAWVPAGELAPAEALGVLGNGTATVLGLVDRPATETVYNLEVARTHTYFVSHAKLWVHNSYLDVFSSRAHSIEILEGKSPAQLGGIVDEYRAAGFTVTTLNRGQDAGRGLRMYDNRGRLLSWSPGTSGRHGGPYWKVSDGQSNWRVSAATE